MTIGAGEHVFLDTNVLLCASDRSRQQHSDALKLISMAPAGGIHLFVSGQILREYLVVATRPMDQNGLGMTPREALDNIERIAERTGIIDENRQVAKRLRKLVSQYALHGKRMHDANVVATMTSRGIETLVTENRRDFDGIDQIQIMDIAQATSTIRQP